MNVVSMRDKSPVPPDNQTPFDQLYSVEYAAEVWGVNRFTVYRWAGDSTIRSVLLGKSRKIPHSEIVRVCTEGIKG